VLVHRPSRRPDHALLRLLLALALTGLASATLVGLVYIATLLVDPRPPPTSDRNNAVVMRGMSQESWDKNRGRNTESKSTQTADAKPKAPEKLKKEVIPKGQVVDVPKGNEQVDDNAKYLAESNNAVKKETHAKDQTALYKNAKNQRTDKKVTEGMGLDAAEKASLSGNEGLAADDAPLLEAAPKLAIKIPDIKHRDELKLKSTTQKGVGPSVSNREESEAVKGNSKVFQIVPGANATEGSAGRIGKLGVLNLLPSSSVLDQISGAAPNDSLREVDEGEGTYLNTKEWKFASFFNRVKQNVGQTWNPVREITRRDPSGNIYGNRDRNTLLAITLDADGHLRDAYVEKSSGLDFLDLEAVKAFERAQPFMNPPPALLDENKLIQFKFGFTLSMGYGGGKFQLFRRGEK
jgi:TonB family protein